MLGSARRRQQFLRAGNPTVISGAYSEHLKNIQLTTNRMAQTAGHREKGPPGQTDPSQSRPTPQGSPDCSPAYCGAGPSTTAREAGGEVFMPYRERLQNRSRLLW